MAVNRQMFDACQKIARANPGTRIVLAHSNTNTILLVNQKKNKRWVVNRKGEIRRVVVQP